LTGIERNDCHREQKTENERDFFHVLPDRPASGHLSYRRPH
jgi:hypothetical protein